MGTLIIIVFTLIVVVSSVRDIAKKAMKPVIEEVNPSLDDNEVEDVESPEGESEDYIYYNPESEQPVQPEPQPMVKKKKVGSVVLNASCEEIVEDEFQFDLRQAVISQTILQNDYVDNLK